MKKRNLVSTYVVADKDTGELIRSRNVNITLPLTVKFPKDFVKIHDLAKVKIDKAYMWHFVILTDYLEYGTNRLVDRHIGRRPKPLTKNDIAELLDVCYKTVLTFMNKMVDIHAIIKMKSQYYISPAYASRSAGIEIQTFMEMIEYDDLILPMVDDKQRSIIEKHYSLP